MTCITVKDAGSPSVCDLMMPVMEMISSTFESLFVSAMAGSDNSMDVITIDAMVLLIFMF
ncbi:MAG: hypothetical protein U9N07_08030 [Euryarchaeota archaeon]|nr:hypothetical protein [Euryarchaeota archaeon]